MPLNKNVCLEKVPCDFCGGNDLKLIFRQRDDYINAYKNYEYAFPVVSCLRCGLVFVNPRPTKESIGFFYPDHYHDERLPGTMSHRYQRQSTFLPNLRGGGVILDVGCAKGDFLGWLAKSHILKMYGCDAYSGGIREGYSIDFLGKDLPDCHYPTAYFDYVTSWAVLEHVHTPKIYFNEIARILKPAGTFVFVVPNFNSLMCRVSKRDDIARHIYQFTPKSIANYLRTSGFSSWNIQFDDTIFDGRGTGAVMALFGSKRPFRWLDRIIFNFHWEKHLRIGGTMLITATK